VAVIPEAANCVLMDENLMPSVVQNYNSVRPVVYKDVNMPVILRHILQQISGHVSVKPSEFFLQGVRCQLVSAEFFETSAIRRYITQERSITISDAFEARRAESAADTAALY
jgi:hypothetical protein